ncbi:MAG TPA: hypothetical protein ENJ05_02985 [Thiotrichales bacterium]|nr:hypothetical protein [Thiotrichales bacterium]
MWSKHLIPLALLLLAGLANAYEPKWRSLKEDGLHDPQGPGIKLLQEPSEALSVLPPDTVGNQVDWMRALKEGYINPRTNLWPETKVRIRDTDILFRNTGEMPLVRFPHSSHTLWLDCNNCHDRIFLPKIGANPVNMFSILQGEYCGRCHGAVAFPLTECNRCHSVPRSKVEQ